MIERFYERGYGDAIMPVIPPGAEISPHSRISPSAVGKIPGVWTKNGWVGLDLTKRPAMSLGQAKDYERLGSNFGLAADQYPAIDIDVDDVELTLDLIPTFFKLLGEAPVRYSKPGRALLMYASDAPLPRVVMTLERDGESHAVELLGRNRQYVVQGTHPTGQKYGFSPGHDIVPTGELSTITEEDVFFAFNQVAEALQLKGWSSSMKIEGVREERELVDQEDLKAPSAQDLARIVKRIPNRYDDRAGWIRVGHAIKAAAQDFPQAGYQIWDWWSQQWEGGNDPEEVERNWGRMRSPFEVGYPYLLSLAGKKDALVQEMFSPDPGADPADEPPAPFGDSDRVEYTDAWVLEQIESDLNNRLLYNPSRGRWMIWDGTRWKDDTNGAALSQIGRVLSNLSASLWTQGVIMGKEGGALRNAAKKYQNVGGINAVKALAESELGVSNDRFDTDSAKLNTPAGVVDLRSGEVSPPSPGVLVSRSTTVAPAGSYRAGDAPRWEAFLHDLSGGDPEMLEFYHRLCGYCLTGETSEKALFYIWGANSDTGKSTFIRIIQELLADYSDTVAVDSVIGGKGNSGIPTDLAKIAGSRLVTATEPGARQSWNEERVKAMTGGDLITARFLYQDEFSYYPTYKILIVGNHEPDLTNVDDSMLRRIRIIPANHKVPREKQIPNLDQLVIREEGAAVLQWMIEGSRTWYAEGLTMPQAVRDATDAYIEDEAILDHFVESRCTVDPEAWTAREDLYRAWRIFANTRGEDPGTLKTFKRTFAPMAAKLNLTDERRVLPDGTRPRGYHGIALREASTTLTPGG